MFKLLLSIAMFAGCALAEDATFYYVPLVAPPAYLTQRLYPNAPAPLGGIGVQVTVPGVADQIEITVTCSVAGKLSTVTKTAGRQDAQPWQNDQGAWFPLWSQAQIPDTKITSIAVSVTRGAVKSSKSVTDPVIFQQY